MFDVAKLEFISSLNIFPSGLQRKVGELSSELDVVKAENREIISQKHDMENKIRVCVYFKIYICAIKILLNKVTREQM